MKIQDAHEAIEEVSKILGVEAERVSHGETCIYPNRFTEISCEWYLDKKITVRSDMSTTGRARTYRAPFNIDLIVAAARKFSAAYEAAYPEDAAEAAADKAKADQVEAAAVVAEVGARVDAWRADVDAAIAAPALAVTFADVESLVELVDSLDAYGFVPVNLTNAIFDRLEAAGLVAVVDHMTKITAKGRKAAAAAKALIAHLDDKTIALNTVPDYSGSRSCIKEVFAVDTGRGYVKRFGLGFVPEGEEGRQVFQGPMVPGPWAYAFGLCTVIDNHGGTGAQRERNIKGGIEFDVVDGDQVTIDGVRFVVRVTKGYEKYLNLEKLDA